MKEETYHSDHEKIIKIRDELADRFQDVQVLSVQADILSFKAVNPHAGRTVFLQIVNPESHADSGWLETFHDEAKKMVKTVHSNIQKTYGDGICQTLHYRELEWIECESLKSLIQKRRSLSPGQIQSWLVPVAEGLEAASSIGLSHSCVTSHHILMEKGKVTRPVLVFFNPESESRDHLPYRSPESIENGRNGPASHIFSLGVVVYECLTGRLPFHADSEDDIKHRILYDDPPPLSSVNLKIHANFNRWAAKCLQKNPPDRFVNCIQLINAFIAAASGISQPSVKSTEENVETAGRPVRVVTAHPKNKKWMILTLFMIVILASIGIIFFTPTKKRREPVVYSALPRVEATAPQDVYEVFNTALDTPEDPFLNLREGPGPRYPVIAKMDDGTQVKVLLKGLGPKGQWCKLLFISENVTGYANSRWIRPIDRSNR